MLVNGIKKDFKGKSVQDMLNSLNVSKNKVIVELNLKILPKEEYDKTTLREEDEVEIVAFVGGG